MPSVSPAIDTDGHGRCTLAGFQISGPFTRLAIALQLRIDRLHHFIGAQRAAADLGIDIIGFGEAQFPQHAFDRLVRQLDSLRRKTLFRESCGPATPAGRAAHGAGTGGFLRARGR